MLNLQLLHLRPDLKELGVEVVEMVHQHIPGLPCLRLATSLLWHHVHFPFNCAGVTCPSSSLSSTLMGESAFLLGLALADGRTVFLPVKLLS